ncbi:transposase [Streptomyces sp. NPDC048417]|uniref:transposase n=1 Tax=Streptomyces sp. NPDC048417 TaxID=3155387 RepID=UPI003441EA84
MTITIRTWVMGDMQKIRAGRHCTFVMHVHLVFVTRFRHKVFTDAYLRRMEEIMRSVCTDFECEWSTPSRASPPAACAEKFPDLVRHYWRASKLWSGSYFAGTVGGAPLSVVRQYIEQQNRPV